jgi:hypothetical protein
LVFDRKFNFQNFGEENETVQFFLKIGVFSEKLNVFFLPNIPTVMHAPPSIIWSITVACLVTGEETVGARELNAHEAGQRRIVVHAGVRLGHGWVLSGVT